jgi:hypothetical protein
MSIVSRAVRGAVRAFVLVGRSIGRALRVVAYLLLVVAALLLPAPILGRPRFQRPGRRNQPAEVDRRR